MLAVGIQRHHRVELAQPFEAGQERVALAAVGRERVHLHAELARHLGRGIA